MANIIETIEAVHIQVHTDLLKAMNPWGAKNLGVGIYDLDEKSPALNLHIIALGWESKDDITVDSVSILVAREKVALFNPWETNNLHFELAEEDGKFNGFVVVTRGPETKEH